MILCGGRGTRLREYTEAIPKVLVEIGGRPVLWHIMKIYAHHGYGEFVLALGYLGDRVKEFFLDYDGWRGRDIRLVLGRNSPPEILSSESEGWSLVLCDTGSETNTGGRIHRLAGQLGGETFFATYGDGVADVDLGRLLDFHRSHGRAATVTVVRPRLSFGLLEIEDGQVTSFREKPWLDGWVNGGFFVFEPRIFDYLDPTSVLEQEPMQRLAAEGQLMAYRHEGFWACMDTYKDNVELNARWDAGQAPWRVWR